MTLSFLILIEIILFNLTFLFFFQPNFIFDFLNMSEYKIRKLKIAMFGIGSVMLCFLFAWSFYFGAKFIIFKNAMNNL